MILIQLVLFCALFTLMVKVGVENNALNGLYFYMISTAAEDEDYVYEKAVSGLNGWVDCFEKAEFKGLLFCGGINDMGEAAGKEKELTEAYEFGRALV